MTSPADRVKVLQAETESLKACLSALPAEAWGKPSACESWTVADVAAHIAGALDSYTGNLTRGLQGDASPAPGRPDAGTWSAAPAEERVRRAEEAARRVVVYRESLGDRLLPTLYEAIDGLERLLGSLTSEDWDRQCYHGRGVIPFPTQVTYAVLEICLHGWDIRSRLEVDAHVSAEGVCYLIQHLSEYLHWVFTSDLDLAKPRCYRFVLTGSIAEQKDLIIDGQQARLAGGNDYRVEAVFQCDAETFLMLMCGRLKFAEAVNEGLLLTASGSGTPGVFSRWSQAI